MITAHLMKNIIFIFSMESSDQERTEGSAYLLRATRNFWVQVIRFLVAAVLDSIDLKDFPSKIW